MKNCQSCNREFHESSRHKNCPACRAKATKDNTCKNCGSVIQRKSTHCLPCKNMLFPNQQRPEIIAVKYALKKSKNKNRNRAISSEVSAEYLLDLLTTQKYKCAYTGLPLSLPRHNGCKDKRLCASLDRIDSSIGYVEGNVQWVIAPINYMKHTLSDAEFRELLSWIK